MAQTHKITGVITDKSGQPIPGASIVIKGTKLGTTADNAGNFSLDVTSSDVLVISAVNFSSYSVKVGSQSSFSVKLVEASSQLTEVVVTALGIRRQAKELGYATTSIKASQLNQAAVVNPATGLSAKVSGVDIRQTDNGVNPQVKVTFRGNRSLTGNNSAAIVVDGVPVDQTYLANINPSDIADITILKGSNASGLYGIDASNGVMIITTKKGKGKFSLSYENTLSFESISYFPALQNEYSGYGGEATGPNPNPVTGGSTYYVSPFTGQPIQVPFENESYGDAYNNLDYPNPDSIPFGFTANQQIVYTPFKDVPNGRTDFFQTGVGDQNKLSGSLGNKWGGLFFSGEHTSKEGTVPMDTYDRNGGRVNGNLTFGKFSASGGISYNNTSTNEAGNSYSQNRPVYWNVLNQLASTDLRKVQDVSQFQNNQGFIDAYEPNPWWNVYNSRTKTSTDQLVSNLQLNYKLTDWLNFTASGGYSRTSEDAPSYIDSIDFPAWLAAPASNGVPGPFGAYDLAVIPGPQKYQYEDIKDHYDDANGDFFLTAVKKANKFKFTLIAGGNIRSRSSYGYWYSNQNNSGPEAGQNIIPSFYTKHTNTDGSAYATFNYKRNDQALYGDLTVGFDSWLFLHGSFRNDWTSILSPSNRSFNYPAVDLSAVLSDKIAAIKNSNTISFLKVTGGYAGTGNVSLSNDRELGVMGNIAGGTNVGGYSVLLPTFGAYSIYPNAVVGSGFPFGTINGYSQNPDQVSNDLKPEKTNSEEVGLQLGLFKNRLNLGATYYVGQSINQTVSAQVSNATGITSQLINAGEIDNNGVELDLALTPLIRAGDFRFDISTNFTYENNKVASIDGGQVELDQINYGQVILGGIYAVQGKAYGQILTTDFLRDPKGRIIVDGTTGLPSPNPSLVDAGNTNYKYFLGISPSFSYKNFTLTAVIDYRAGAKILNEEGNVLDFTGVGAGDATNRQAFIIPNSVINTGTATNPNYIANGNVPITSGAPGLGIGDFWWANYYNNIGMPYVTSAAFWKLREVALTYDLPKKIFGSQPILKGLTLTVSGRNLFMWRPKTNQWSDPEFSTNATGNATGYTTEFQTPPTRVISASIIATIF